MLIFTNAYLRTCFSYTFIKEEVGLSSHSICDWASFCREVLVDWCLRREGRIGGEGKIVEIDESKFGKKKVQCGEDY